MGVISEKYSLDQNFTLGSMRNAMSRYIGVGTYHKTMPKGKILTYKVDDFRKLLKFSKEENIWWRDQIETYMGYELLSELGLDFNQEKMYQSGFEFRSFDEFPEHNLKDVLYALILICEHSLNISDVVWGHDSEVWNNLVFKVLKSGYLTEMTKEEKKEILHVLQIAGPTDKVLCEEFEGIVKLDAFFFKILDVLYMKYKDDNRCLDAMYGEKRSDAPYWDNFNEYQINRHLEQIELSTEKYTGFTVLNH